MKKRVSVNIEVLRLLIIPLVLIIAFLNIYTFIMSHETAEIIIVLIISCLFLLLSYLLFRYVNKAKIIEYDNEHIYIGDKMDLDVITFNKVESIEMKSLCFNGRYALELSYMNNRNMKTTVLFFPRLFCFNLKEFIENISRENKNAKVVDIFVGPFLIDRWKN